VFLEISSRLPWNRQENKPKYKERSKNIQLQNYCVLGLAPLSSILINSEHNVMETGSISILE
jgi:hypothetical protein